LLKEKQDLYTRLFRDDKKIQNDSKKTSKVRAYAYDMTGHAQQCVERYLDPANVHESSLKPVETPCDDHMIPPEEFEAKGSLSPVAANIVLKALFLTRVNRMYIMWTVNALARLVTKWSVACDKRLYRLISYIHNTEDWKLHCFVGDRPEDCKIAQFSDASFGADLTDSKSASGAYLVLVGPNTFVPLCWICKTKARRCLSQQLRI